MIPLESRIASVVVGVVRQVLRDSGATGVVVLEPDSPEGRMFRRWCVDIGLHAVAAEATPVSLHSRAEPYDGREVKAELERAGARMAAAAHRALVVHPANRTVLLLSGVPPEPFLPLGDVPASTVAACTGDWSGPDDLIELADAAGGVEILDSALYRWLERREPFTDAVSGLPTAVACSMRSRFEAGSFMRKRAGLVPKLGYRTIGHDLRT